MTYYIKRIRPKAPHQEKIDAGKTVPIIERIQYVGFTLGWNNYVWKMQNVGHFESLCLCKLVYKSRANFLSFTLGLHKIWTQLVNTMQLEISFHSYILYCQISSMYFNQIQNI